MSSPIVYLNGTYLPIDQAHVPVLDRGFIFGDGVYEVIPVYGGEPFRLKEHLQRLQNSLNGIRLRNPHSDEEWTTLIAGLIARQVGRDQDQSVYLHITRGVAKRDHAFPNPPISPTVLMISNPLVTPPASQRELGVAAITAVDNRWLRCDIKAIALLSNVLLRQQAVEAGAVEALLLRDGYLTEGAASNIMVVRDGVLLAPPKNHLMLPGITYDVVLELAAAHNIPYAVRQITETEVRTAHELWQTSSTKEILPITMLDGQPVHDGRPGPLYRCMYQHYQNYKHAVRTGAAR